MYPHERSLVSRMNNRPFVLLGVNSDQDRERTLGKCREEGMTWRSWWEGSTDGPISSAWNVSGWPTLVLIDHKGVIRAKGHQEVANDGEIDKLVAAAEAEAKAAGG